uniref:Putative secreted peptide n=1 Tax=Anopheles braziliensis TaxID=58242 RepID=A0A2M3ZV46_9DIPT
MFVTSFCSRFFILVRRSVLFCFVFVFLRCYLQINVARVYTNTLIMFPSNRAGLFAYSYTIVASRTRFAQFEVDRNVLKWHLPRVYN